MQPYPPNGYQGGQPGYQGMYAPPPPGLFGTSMGAMGVGTPGIHQQYQQQQQAAGMMAGGAVSAVAGMGTAALTGLGMVGMAAPMLQAGLKGGGFMSTLASGMVGAADQFDPTTHILSTMRLGSRMGGGMGRIGGTIMGTGARMLGARATTSAAMSGVLGGAGMMAGGLVGAALPIAASVAMYEGLKYGGNQIYAGAQNTMQGQGLMNAIGRSNGIQGMQGSAGGVSMGRMMQEMSGEMGTSVDDIGRYAKEMDSQKMFQTARSAKEFKAKFREVMKAVKEISKMTQSTVDEASKTFADLRSQGFYTTADVKAQAVTRQAREATTGISTEVQSAIGQMGGRMAQRNGMRKRFGARLAESSVASISRGIRSGAMSEEDVMEMGGPEQVGLNLARKQMNFLRTSRGRAMMAYSMGADGGPDAGRMSRMLGGASMEELVTGAAGRGLGVLRQAGTKESREKFAKYSGVSMIAMAAAQQKQLYGRVTEKGLTQMLGTMGVGEEESKLMFQQAMGLKSQLKDERAAMMSASASEQYDSRRSAAKYSTRISGALHRGIANPLQKMGSAMYSDIASGLSHEMESLYGSQEYKTSGDEEAGIRHLRRLRMGGNSFRYSGSKEDGSLLGLRTAGSAIASQYSEFTDSKSAAERKYGGASQLKSLVASGDVRKVGDKYISRADLDGAEGAIKRGRAKGESASETAMGSLQYEMGNGDFVSKINKMMNEQTGLGPSVGPSALSHLTNPLSALAGDRAKMRKMNETVKKYGGRGVDIRQENINFNVLKMSGKQGLTTFDDYMKRGKLERASMGAEAGAMLDAAAKEAGGSESEAIRALSSSKDMGLGSLKDIQANKDAFEGTMTGYLNDMSSGGLMGAISTELGLTTGGKRLSRKLSKDPSIRKAYREYMQAVSAIKDQGSPTPEEKASISKKRQALKDVLGEGAEYDAAISVEKRLKSDPAMAATAKKQWSKDGIMTRKLNSRSAADVQESALRDMKAGAKTIDLEKIKDAGVRQAALAYKKGAGGSRSNDLAAGLINATLEDGNISDEERQLLAKASSNRSGGVVGMVNALTSGKLGKKDRKTLLDSGVTEEEIKAARGGGKAGGAALKSIVKKMGQDNFFGDKESATSGATSRKGVEMQYMDKAIEFIDLVDVVVRKLHTAGIEVGEGGTDAEPNTSSYWG